jgi:energy-coupling factor transporter ATP-binding protein EcfA2
VVWFTVSIERVKLGFVPGLEIEFSDRDRAIRQVIEWSEKSTAYPVVVFGPEGCGKTAWLKQASLILERQGFDVIYVDPLRKEYIAYTDIKEVVDRLLEATADTTGYAPIKLADLIIYLANQLLKRWKRKRIAVLVDDVFQAIGIERSEAYVKALLNTIEYPPEPYEKIVIIVATSEGASRARIGRHRWAEITPMWNMSRKGFGELYEKIPGTKPSFDEVWRLTGGNPDMLRRLYLSKWSVADVIKSLIKLKKLDTFILSLSSDERKWLCEAVEDPDTLYTRERIPLLNRLVELNLIVDEIEFRDPELWIDEPPPERDPELGISRLAAWQTPLHREAVRKVLGDCKHM